MSKKIFLSLILAFLITGSLFFILKPVFGADFYRSDRNTTIQADECPKCPSDPTCCRMIKNNSTTEDIFVPTKTCEEWNQFKIHHPISFITLSPCPSGSLSCSSSTANSITLSYSFSNSASGQVSLFRDTTFVTTFSGSSDS